MRNRGEQVDEAMPDAFLMNEKQRNGDSQEWYGLFYHSSSQQFIDKLGGLPIDFDNGGRFCE
jgi:hypothetical protein